jgi:Fe-S cluster biogenesis protein NfuA
MTTDTTTAESLSEMEFEEVAAAVDQIRDRVRHSDPETQRLLDEAIETLTEFNKRGLITLVQMLRDDARGGEILYEAVDTPEVMALFVSHGLIRTDRTLDVLRVIEGIRPYLVTSSVELEVDRVEGDVAYVRFGTGCSAPSQETKDEIMGVIRQRVPGLADVREVVEGTFIGLDTIRVGAPDA